MLWQVLCLIYCHDRVSFFFKTWILLFNIFIYCLFGSTLHWAACGIAVPQLEIRSVPPAREGQKVHRWTARSVVPCCDHFWSVSPGTFQPWCMSKGRELWCCPVHPLDNRHYWTQRALQLWLAFEARQPYTYFSKDEYCFYPHALPC